jgi:hypothetical protein
MTTSSQQQQTQQNATTAPWQPTQGVLGNIIGQLGSQNTAPTALQDKAISNLNNATSNLPDFSGSATGLAGGLLGGLPNFNQNAQANLQGLQGSLSGLANPGNLDPMETPGIGPALQYMQQQVANNVNGQFAAAGRDLSPANSQAAAYGETAAMAPILTGQYNQNVANLQNAAGTLYNAGNTTNNGILGNALTGLGTASSIPGLATQGPLAQLQAAMSGYSLPFSNIGALESLILPMAALGGQSTSQGTTNTQSTPSPLSVMQGLFGGNNPAGPNMLNMGGNILSSLPMLLGF